MKKEDGLSRREFAKAAALTTAAALVPAELIAQQEKPGPTTSAKPPEKAPETPKLSEASQAEADLAYETVIRKYGNRFSEEQKKDIKRLVNSQQGTLDKLRAFNVTNGDQPALVFKLPEMRKLVAPEVKR
ncbi:MAG: hypothetical protein ACXVZX_09240 [Terriglobales bacterium]